MKNQPAILIILLLVLTCLAACAAPTPQPQPNPTPTPRPNSQVVLEMVKRLNSGDVEGSLDYFAEDAVAYLYGFPPTGIEVYSGKDQIRQLWQDSAANHFEWQVQDSSTDGDIVYVSSKTWHDFTRQLEIAPLEYVDVYEVVDGKITTYGSWLTAESLAKLRPALANVMPPEPTPIPPSDPPVSEIKVTIAAGTCATDLPPALKIGQVTVTLDVQDQTNSLYALTIFTLDADKDILDLMVATLGNPPSWAHSLLMKEIEPGKSATFTINVKEGPVHVICWAKPPDMPIGNAVAIPVLP